MRLPRAPLSQNNRKPGGLPPCLGSMIHCFGHAAAGLVFGREDVQPLHHAEILMGKGVTMHDKAPDGPRIEIGPKRDGSEGNILIDVWHTPIGLRHCARNKDRVMPLRRGESLVVDLGEQKMILMDVERMIGKGTIGHRPLFVIAGDHMTEQWSVWVEQPILLEINTRHLLIAGGFSLVVIIS